MGQNTSKNNSIDNPENLSYSPTEHVHTIQDIRKYNNKNFNFPKYL